nr:MAK10-like protein [Tanacetum cinerariifolium]
MGDENPIRTLRDYSKPSHEGFRNTIELPIGNNMVPLRFDTNQLVQNGCSFHRLRSEDPNQHFRDFLKLVDSLDLDGANRKERACVYFNFPFTIKLAIGLNDFQHDPLPHGRILLLGEEENSDQTNVTTCNNIEKLTGTEIEMPVKEVEKEDEAENEPNKKDRKE